MVDDRADKLSECPELLDEGLEISDALPESLIVLRCGAAAVVVYWAHLILRAHFVGAKGWGEGTVGQDDHR
jgi:hypothetical protein